MLLPINALLLVFTNGISIFIEHVTSYFERQGQNMVVLYERDPKIVTPSYRINKSTQRQYFCGAPTLNINKPRFKGRLPIWEGLWPDSPTRHWLGLRYFWLLHSFLPAVLPNGGAWPLNTRGCLRWELGQSETRQTSMHRSRLAVIWGPPPTFRELRKKRPRRNYTSAVFAYYWRPETRQGAGERAGLQIKGDKTREKLAQGKLFGLECSFLGQSLLGHSWPETLESKSS